MGRSGRMSLFLVFFFGATVEYCTVTVCVCTVSVYSVDVRGSLQPRRGRRRRGGNRRGARNGIGKSTRFQLEGEDVFCLPPKGGFYIRVV